MEHISSDSLCPSPVMDAEAFLQWIADCLHVMTCPECLAEQRPLPALTQSALPFLRQHTSDPLFMQWVRRLGGMFAAPRMMQQEINTTEYLMQERARSVADRHTRFLTAITSDMLTTHTSAASPAPLLPQVPLDPDSSLPGLPPTSGPTGC